MPGHIDQRLEELSAAIVQMEKLHIAHPRITAGAAAEVK